VKSEITIIVITQPTFAQTLHESGRILLSTSTWKI